MEQQVGDKLRLDEYMQSFADEACDICACLSVISVHEALRALSQILAGAEISTSTCDSAWKMVEECNDTDQVKAPQYANELLNCNGVLDHSDQGPRASGQCDPGSVIIVPTRELCMQIYQQGTVTAGSR